MKNFNDFSDTFWRIIQVLLIIGSIIGYILNIVKLILTDFSAPHFPEVMRIFGIFFWPSGLIMGYVNF